VLTATESFWAWMAASRRTRLVISDAHAGLPPSASKRDVGDRLERIAPTVADGMEDDLLADASFCVGVAIR
jgi:hypothetical protein